MTTLAPVRSVEQWVAELNAEWGRIRDRAVEGFVELGRNLTESKKGFNHGEWQTAIADKLEFNVHTAQTFMRIAKWVDKNVGIPNVIELLPPNYSTIDQIVRLDETTLKRFIGKGIISPNLKQNEIPKILHTEKVKADEKRVLELRPRPGKYRTIVIDPAWEYDEFSKGAVAGKIGQYAKQTYEQLWELNLKQWAEDECHLYCWATNAYVLKAGALIEHWGFEYKQILTWVKPPPFGLGRNYRNSTEQVLFAMIGDRTTRANNLPTHFEGPRGEHSEKPESFYEIVRLASYPPYGEGNRRRFRSDFTDLFMEGEPLKAAV